MFHHPRESAYLLTWICDNHYLGKSDEEIDWLEDQKWDWKESCQERYGWWSERRWAVEMGLVPKLRTGQRSLNADDVRELSTLSDIVGQYIQLKRWRTGHWSGDCPFHESQSRMSLSITDSKGVWNCFGCGAAGNIFHFLMRIEKITFTQALSAVSEFYGKQH